MPMYTDENIFNEKDIADRYEKFIVESLNKVSREFESLFQWVNGKILFPNLLWKEGSELPVVRIIDFGIGSGKFTIPHIKTLIDAEVHVQVLGFDNSNYMLGKFKKNAKEELGTSFPSGENEFLNSFGGKIEKITLCNENLNNHEKIVAKIKKFLNGESQKGDNRSEATLVCFAQVWHYLKNPEDFLNKIIIENLRDSYILHYEPTYYFKLLDGNFDQTDVSLDFSCEMAQLHRRFWMHYFFLRDKIRSYSTQRIKGAEANWCFKRYKEENFINMGKYDKVRWTKDLSFSALIDIIEDPILSAQYVGLNESQRKALANEMQEFPEKEKLNKDSFRFGYIGHLFSTKKLSDSRYPLQISIVEKDKVYEVKEKVYEVKERGSVLDVFKSMFPEFKFFFFGLTYINRFSFEGFKLIRVGDLEPWKDFIDEITKKKIPSVAEIIVKEKGIGDGLLIEGLLNKRRIVIPKKPLSPKVQDRINSVLDIMRTKALNKIPWIKGENVGAFYFPLFSQDIVESIYLNIVPTIVFGCDGKIKKELLENITETTRREWRSAFDKYLKQVRQEFKKHALRSAVAAIMARNMSHNIGSHVLASIGSEFPLDLNVPENQIFYKYIQQRMDFIAQVSTEFPEWSYPVWFIKDLMKRFYRQKTLLENISKYEDLTAHNWKDNNEKSIVIKIKDRNNKFIIPFNLQNSDSSFNDYLVAIPGGIVGNHAFYVILENIIRNSAKYGWANLETNEKDIIKNLEIMIETEDKPENDFIMFRIWDNVSDVFRSIKNVPDKRYIKEEHLKDLPENLSWCEEEAKKLPLHQQINCMLIKSFIDKIGKLKKENWGLMEMKIATGFLQQKSTPEIGKEGEEVLNIIKAISVPTEDKNVYRLGYQFNIPKPKEVLIIGKLGDIENKINNEKARKNSIYYEKIYQETLNLDFEFMILIDDKENALIDKILPGKNDKWDVELEKLPYRLFLITDDKLPENQIKDHPVLKNRIIVRSSNDFKEMLNKDFGDFKIELYKKWIEKLEKKRNSFVKIFVKLTIQGATTDTDFENKIFENESAREQITNALFVKLYEQGKTLNKNEIKNSLEEVVTNSSVKGKRAKFVIKIFNKVKNIDQDCINESVKSIISNILEKREPFTMPLLLSNDVRKKEDEGKDLIKIAENFKYPIGTESTGIVYSRHADIERFNSTYIESLSGSSIHFALLSNLPSDEYFKKKLVLQLIENGLLRIVIIDERIGDFITKGDNKLKFQKAGITVPTGKIKIDINGEHKYKIKEESLESEEFNFNGLEENKYDVLVIHQGILDKLKVSPEDFMRKVEKKIPFVVVTSGRGEPSNIPKNAKFMPFSTIESFLLTDYHEKFLLTQTLMCLKNRR